MTYSSPLKLFWYNKEQNFGDALSPAIVAHVARREVVWAGHQTCEMYGSGSLIKMIGNHQKAPRANGRKPFIWGSGVMSGLQDLAFLKYVRVALLRGPITSALLRRNDRSFGDPGLLIADVVKAGSRIVPIRGDRVGLVPHMHFADDRRFRDIAAADPRIELIDVRDDDPFEVARKIASCAHVISQSLHGLITADAFGIPNTWLDPKGIHGGALLKFHDYAAGIGRSLGLPIRVDQVAGVAAKASTNRLSYADGISAAKDALYSSFPAGLVQRGLQTVSTNDVSV